MMQPKSLFLIFIPLVLIIGAAGYGILLLQEDEPKILWDDFLAAIIFSESL